MGTLSDVLSLVTFVAIVVCHIIVIVKIFQAGQTGLGILGIVMSFACCCPGVLFTLIYGWVKSGAWGLRNVMLAYTIALVLYFAAGALMPAEVREARQKQIEDMFKKQQP